MDDLVETHSRDLFFRSGNHEGGGNLESQLRSLHETRERITVVHLLVRGTVMPGNRSLGPMCAAESRTSSSASAIRTRSLP